MLTTNTEPHRLFITATPDERTKLKQQATELGFRSISAMLRTLTEEALSAEEEAWGSNGGQLSHTGTMGRLERKRKNKQPAGQYMAHISPDLHARLCLSALAHGRSVSSRLRIILGLDNEDGTPLLD